MKALIIISHGSRHEDSNAEITNLVESLGIVLEDKYEIITQAFLEFSSPTIQTAFDSAFEQGAENVTVLPLFISAGKHVKKDIPLAIGEALERWPDRHIDLKPHIGSFMGMIQMINDAV